MSDAQTVIAALGLQPHPEGGYYVETWRSLAHDGKRAPGSAIYYLLTADQRSAWHRIDADETWHYYAGAPLRLSVAASAGDEPPRVHELGPDVERGQRPQVVVPAGAWQSAISTGAWTLVGCTVSPAFAFEGFELAEPGWEPGAR